MTGDRTDAVSLGASSMTQSESQTLETKPDGLSKDSAKASLSNEQSDKLGGKFPREASLLDGLRTVRFSDLKEGYRKPCVRDSLLTGIGAGFGVGGLRAILGARIPIICNWAVGSFMLGSVLMHEYCQRWRREEKQNIKRIVEVVDRKRAERRLRERDAIDESRATK